jgi:hypothetical protein
VNPDLIRIQGFDDQKLKKEKVQMKKYFDPKLQLTYVQATEEAFHPQKRTSSTSKNEIYQLFLRLWVIFAPLSPDPIRSRIRSTARVVT